MPCIAPAPCGKPVDFSILVSKVIGMFRDSAFMRAVDEKSAGSKSRAKC